MLHKPFSSKDDLKKSFWENIHFGRGVVWYGVNQMITHFSKHPFRQVTVFYSSFSSNHPGRKYIVRQRIESISSPKQQRRPLPSILYLSFYGFNKESKFPEG